MIECFIIDSMVRQDDGSGVEAVFPKVRSLFTINRTTPQRADLGLSDPLSDPNVEVVRIQCTPEVLAEIKAHPDYGDAAVLSEETI